MDKFEKIAERLYFYVTPWEVGCPFEEFFEDLKNDPFPAIEFLLNEIEELKEVTE